jgi:hypothetical protein
VKNAREGCPFGKDAWTNAAALLIRGVSYLKLLSAGQSASDDLSWCL